MPAEQLHHVFIGRLRAESRCKEVLDGAARVSIVNFQFFARLDLLKSCCECRRLRFSAFTASARGQQVSSFTVFVQSQ